MPRRHVLPAGLLTAALALAATATPAAADTPPVSQSRGFFLAGSVAGTDLATAAGLPVASGNPLTGAYAVNTGGPAVTQANPQGLGQLADLGVPVGDGVTLPLGSGLQFAGLNQYATAAPDGSAASSSGAIADNGTLQVGNAPGGPAGQASIDLGAAAASVLAQLPEQLRTLLGGVGDAKLTAGALAARAEQQPFDPAGAAGEQRGSYQIGSLTLSLTGPTLLTGLLKPVTDAFGAAETTLQAALKDAVVALPGVGDLAEVSIDVPDLPNADTLFDGLTSVTSHGITVDLAAGTVTVDLVELVEAAGGPDINSLPPDTDLLALVLDALPGVAAGLATGIENALERGRTALIDALGDATVTATLAGVAIPTLTAAPLLTALGVTAADDLPGVSALTAALTALGGGLTSTLGTALGALGTALKQLLSLTANRQVQADGAFTETALAVGVLPGGVPGSPVASALLDLGLANAAVGPGAPLPAVATTPTPTAPATTVPMLANTGPTATLGSLALGVWAVVAGAGLLVAANALRRSRLLHVGSHRHW